MPDRRAETRCYVVEYLGKNRARWKCRVGHQWTGVLHPKRHGFVPAEVLLKRFAVYWSEQNGGVHATCRQCARVNTNA